MILWFLKIIFENNDIISRKNAVRYLDLNGCPRSVTSGWLAGAGTSHAASLCRAPCPRARPRDDCAPALPARGRPSGHWGRLGLAQFQPWASYLRPQVTISFALRNFYSKLSVRIVWPSTQIFANLAKCGDWWEAEVTLDFLSSSPLPLVLFIGQSWPVFHDPVSIFCYFSQVLVTRILTSVVELSPFFPGSGSWFFFRLRVKKLAPVPPRKSPSPTGSEKQLKQCAFFYTVYRYKTGCRTWFCLIVYSACYFYFTDILMFV